MAIFDNMRDKLTQAGQSTVQKAKGLSEVAKLNAQISGLENQVNDMYRQIGYAIYCAHHEDPLPEVAGAINQITEMHKSIENCRAQIKAINTADTCPQCGAKVSKSMVFCGGCGYRLVAEQPEQPAAAGQPIFCSNCGTACPPDSAFCPSCGQAVKTSN